MGRPAATAAAAADAPLVNKRGFRLMLPPGLKDDTPLVVTLGWYGAQDRHVAKYAELLAKHGYPSVRGVMPPWAVFSPVAAPRRAYAADLLRFVQGVDPEGRRPLVFYVFSNGGAFVLEQVDALVASDPRYRQLGGRIKGVVFDSAPCYMALLVGATAIGHGLPWPLPLLAAAFFLLLALLMPHRPSQYWRHMRDLRLGQRSLYLYSEDDPLCMATWLDDLIAARRAAGADVQAVRWERSQHVAHLLKHYKAYTAALLGFLQTCAAA